VKSEGSEDLNQNNLIGKVEGNPPNEPEKNLLSKSTAN